MTRVNRLNKALPVFVVLTVLLVSSTFIVASRAADYTKIGVKVGDSANYSVESHAHSCDRLQINVTEVTGTVVNLTYTYSWSNGTIVNSGHDRGDVSTGYHDFLYCGGLKKGDLTYIGSTWYFNDTVTMEFAGANRTVNVLYASVTEYFDQATGMVVKLVQSEGEDNFTMISTNMWSAASPPGPTIDPTLLLIGGGIVVAAIVVVAAVVMIRRRK